MAHRLTHADLADQLGLARATVTRILNGHPKAASAETVARVLAAADVAGYVRPGAPERPSMAEIGRQLGLSHAAVNKALRGARGGSRTTQVSAETRAAVLAKAEELGYVAPPLKRRRYGWS